MDTEREDLPECRAEAAEAAADLTAEKTSALPEQTAAGEEKPTAAAEGTAADAEGTDEGIWWGSEGGKTAEAEAPTETAPSPADTAAERIRADTAAFRAVFPQAAENAAAIPAEVWQQVGGGMSLVTAYALYQARCAAAAPEEKPPQRGGKHAGLRRTHPGAGRLFNGLPRIEIRRGERTTWQSIMRKNTRRKLRSAFTALP